MHDHWVVCTTQPWAACCAVLCHAVRVPYRTQLWFHLTTPADSITPLTCSVTLLAPGVATTSHKQSPCCWSKAGGKAARPTANTLLTKEIQCAKCAAALAVCTQNNHHTTPCSSKIHHHTCLHRTQ
jgi:hypothetical protein